MISEMGGDHRGFVFSLDAALAILVVVIILTGVAHAASPEPDYRRSYLRLETYANDALEVLRHTGALNSILKFAKAGEMEAAENLARAITRDILPSEIQFKLVIGDNNLTVYPSESPSWESAFHAAKEVAVAARIVITPSEDDYRVLVWVDDNNDNTFTNEIKMTTAWKFTETSDENFFGSEILKWDNSSPANRYYKAVFIPDAQRDFNSTTENNLVTFARHIGRLVVGGDTLWYNRQANGTLSVPELYEVLGVDPSYIARPPLDARNTGMELLADNHPITASPYYIGYRTAYAGGSYYIYVYRPSAAIAGVTSVLAHWDNVPGTSGIDTPPWRGVLFRDSYLEGELGREGTGVLFNMRLAQSAIGANVGKTDWITMAKRAIYWGEADWTFKPISLYVWRGGVVS
jgi:hypothetical protein